MKLAWIILPIAIIALGSFLVYNGLSVPYLQRDMNGDGVINYLDVDANGDGKIDMTDVLYLSARYGKSAGDPGFSYRLDFNGDGIINQADADILASYFGQGYDMIGIFLYRMNSFSGVEILTGFAMIAVGVIFLTRFRKKGATEA